MSPDVFLPSLMAFVIEHLIFRWSLSMEVTLQCLLVSLIVGIQKKIVIKFSWRLSFSCCSERIVEANWLRESLFWVGSWALGIMMLAVVISVKDVLCSASKDPTDFQKWSNWASTLFTVSWSLCSEHCTSMTDFSTAVILNSTSDWLSKYFSAVGSACKQLDYNKKYNITGYLCHCFALFLIHFGAVSMLTAFTPDTFKHIITYCGLGAN